LPGPYVAVERGNRNDAKPVEPEVAVSALADMIGEDTFAMIVCRGPCELARARNIAPSDVEPIALHPPLRNVRHNVPVLHLYVQAIKANCILHHYIPPALLRQHLELVGDVDVSPYQGEAPRSLANLETPGTG